MLGSVEGTISREPPPEARWAWAAPAIVTAILFGLHLWATRDLTGPSVVFDEGGYLGSARWLAGGAQWDMPTSPSYAVGYPMLLAPVMAAFDTADAQWRGVMVVNAALLASLFPWLLHVFGQVLGAPRNLALVGAVVGSSTPCVVAAGASAIAENLVLPLVGATVAATWALTTSGRPRRRVASYAFGPLVAFLFITHPRFTLVAALGLVVLVVGARLGIVSRGVAMTNGVLLVAVAGAGTILDRVVRRARWDEVEMLQGGPADWLRLAGRPSSWGEMALTAAGQVWYLAAGSLGLSVVGIWFLVSRMSGSSESAGGPSAVPTAETEVGTSRDRRFTVGFLLAAAGAVFVTSVLFFAQNQFRADHWVYGRHNDSFTPLWVGAGVVALAGTAGLRRRLAWLAGAAALVVSTGLALWATRDPATMNGEFSLFAVPALSRLVASQPTSVFARATGIAVAAVAVIAAAVAASDRGATRRHLQQVGLLAVPLVLVAFFSWVGYGAIVGTATFRDYLTADWSTPHELERLGVTTLEVEGRTARSLPSLLYPFALPGVDVTMYDAERSEPTGPYVLARVDDPIRQASGDRLVLVDRNLLYDHWDAPDGIGVWVRPGPAQDRLAAAGRLLPVGFPTVLPAEARSVDLRITGGLGDDGTLRIEAGTEAHVRVVGRHTGTSSPWPDARSAHAGRVQVRARVEPDDPRRSSGIGSGGDLDRWVRPGQQFTADVTIRTIGPMFAELAPGRYSVQLGVGQTDASGEEWFAASGSEASFALVVV